MRAHRLLGLQLEVGLDAVMLGVRIEQLAQLARILKLFGMRVLSRR